MSVSTLTVWGHTIRPWGYEVRVDYRDSLAPLYDINEWLEWRYVPTSDEIAAAIEARRVRIEARLQAREEEYNTEHLDEMTFIYVTLARMRRVIRDAFKAASGMRACRFARWLLDNCNDTQLANVFNKADITDLKARLVTKRTRLEAWEAARAACDAEGGE